MTSGVEISFVTSNRGKVLSLESQLKDSDFILKQIVLKGLYEIQSSSLKEIAIRKAECAYEKIRTPLVVSDSGLFIDALNGFPGTNTKYCQETLGVKGIVKLMEDKSDKTCYLDNILVFTPDGNKFYPFVGKVFGSIAEKVSNNKNPRSWGAIWSIFIPKTANRTIVELGEREYQTIREKAQVRSVWVDFRNFLEEFYGKN
ncbi:MAG: hypothetical protein LBI29_02820 [Rickettsiales bacterium]|jgi:XTP/dITP diphosphohydrolase|nr:hypothetical protein [Rickettsiales bacterium]